MERAWVIVGCLKVLLKQKIKEVKADIVLIQENKMDFWDDRDINKIGRGQTKSFLSFLVVTPA